MLFVCYPKCTTCMKAQKYLDSIGVSYMIRNIKDERPSRDEIALWKARSGLPLRRFFNTSGLKYRELALKDRLPGMSEEEMLDLLASDGMLVKRPLLVAVDCMLVGFKESDWQSVLCK